MGADFWIVLRWWGALFLVGAAAFPFTRWLFGSKETAPHSSHISNSHRDSNVVLRIRELVATNEWWDHGYLFSKAVGMVLLPFFIYFFGTFHIVPNTVPAYVVVLLLIFGLGVIVGKLRKRHGQFTGRRHLLRVGILELFFFLLLLLWSYVKAHEPSIHGLEKFMDYGFTKSIMNSRFFPAPDMWYAGGTINYYHFGHTVMAVLTRLSGLDLAYTFNLMLAALFAFTLTMSFSIGVELMRRSRGLEFGNIGVWEIINGVLTSLLVTLAGNMQTIYAFTKGYTGEDVKPFWDLAWPLTEFWQKLPEGLNTYWYANATRFIPFTIHEFPSYSFVVSDVHGHVLSLPFVLLASALLIKLFSGTEKGEKVTGRGIAKLVSSWGAYGFYGLLGSVLLMTNALDGPIYMGMLVIFLLLSKSKFTSDQLSWWKEKLVYVLGVAGIAVAASLPFLLHFKSFVNGVAINCPPKMLAETKLGPLIFETVDKCQRSPLWMMALLWGFFVYCGVWLFVATKKEDLHDGLKSVVRILKVFFVYSLVLISIPEFIYFKDIYPAHFRSNTMFKLGYQAFILFSLVSGFTIVSFLKNTFRSGGRMKRWVFLGLLVPQLFLVSIYPLFSVRSYFNSLRDYQGIDGVKWLRGQYPGDTALIEWINTTVLKSPLPTRMLPVIVEADGDSYTDYNRVSAFTGLPTIVGWAVHEWLWRGTYDVVAPRREEIRTVYEGASIGDVEKVLTKYNVEYIVVGTLEREKFLNLNVEQIEKLATPVFTSADSTLYRVSRMSSL